jgi:protein-disulfide isomerase
MHDCLYEHQQAPDDKHLETYAALLGLDVAQFTYDISNHVYSGRDREDFLSGILSGVNGTPTFYINGIRYNGSWDLETLLETLTPVIQKSLRFNYRSYPISV